MKRKTDRELLDWLESQSSDTSAGWVCRPSTTGRGMRLHETSLSEAASLGYTPSPTVRIAIREAMLAKEKS